MAAPRLPIITPTLCSFTTTLDGVEKLCAQGDPNVTFTTVNGGSARR